MTVCNMTIEGGGRAGMIAPDETTFAWFTEQRAPRRAHGRRARRRRSSAGARCAATTGAEFDTRGRDRRRRDLSAGHLGHQPRDGPRGHRARALARRSSTARPTARRPSARCTTWRSSPARRSSRSPIDRVFIGSCTNSRIGDLRAAAEVVAGRSVAAERQRDGRARLPAGQGAGRGRGPRPRLPRGRLRLARGRLLDVPGHEPRHPRSPGERCASTSNRNFEGRQGRGGRTHLVSPQMAAAAAIEGRFVDIREWR